MVYATNKADIKNKRTYKKKNFEKLFRAHQTGLTDFDNCDGQITAFSSREKYTKTLCEFFLVEKMCFGKTGKSQKCEQNSYSKQKMCFGMTLGAKINSKENS